MPFLSAKSLTEDPKGLSRLKAVIATDPGYEARAREAASRNGMSLCSTPVAVAQEATACASLTAANPSHSTSSDHVPDPLPVSMMALSEPDPVPDLRVLSPA